MHKPKVIVICGPTAIRENSIIYRTRKKNKWRDNISGFDADL